MNGDAELVGSIVSCNPVNSSTGSRLQPGQLRLYRPIPSSHHHHPLDFIGHRRLVYPPTNLSSSSSSYSRLSFCSPDEQVETDQGHRRHYEASAASSAAGSKDGRRCPSSLHDTAKVMKGNPMRKRKASAEDDSMESHGGRLLRGNLNGFIAAETEEEEDFAGSSVRGRTHYPEDLKDETYWKRRRKNNEAAKRSRDARRAREGEMAMRASILEDENLRLRAQVALLTNESHRLYCRLYSGFGLL